jgi:hypothetical protein
MPFPPMIFVPARFFGGGKGTSCARLEASPEPTIALTSPNSLKSRVLGNLSPRERQRLARCRSCR